MTNKIADFNDDCSTFDLDSPELENYKVKIKNQIDEKYELNLIEKVLGSNDGEYTRPKMSRNPKYKSIEKTHGLTYKNNVTYDKTVLLLMIFAVVYIFFIHSKDIKNSNLDNGVLIGFGVFFVIIPIFIYRAFFMKHKVKIRITKTGIEYEENLISWNNIIDIGILKAKGARFNEHKIILGTITKGIIEINLTTLNVSPEQFADVVIMNSKNVLQHRV